MERTSSSFHAMLVALVFFLCASMYTKSMACATPRSAQSVVGVLCKSLDYQTLPLQSCESRDPHVSTAADTLPTHPMVASCRVEVILHCHLKRALLLEGVNLWDIACPLLRNRRKLPTFASPQCGPRSKATIQPPSQGHSWALTRVAYLPDRPQICAPFQHQYLSPTPTCWQDHKFAATPLPAACAPPHSISYLNAILLI